jgi:hypothetical protein
MLVLVSEEISFPSLQVVLQPMAVIEHFVKSSARGTINITLVDVLFLSVNPSTLDQPQRNSFQIKHFLQWLAFLTKRNSELRTETGIGRR